MKALVTGGGGSLGGEIVRQLRARDERVTTFSRREYPGLDALGVRQIRGYLSAADAVARACEGADVVFHVASKTGIWGPYEDYFAANVVGTENVIAACRKLGIDRLVYTSSPSVVFSGADMEGVDESAPYAEHFETAYPRTKMLAEKMVLAANDARLATVALRPHLVWGPGDSNLVPRIIARGRTGQLRRIGRTDHLVDSVYIVDAARAHLLAADRLSPGATIGGRAYFITQGEPVGTWALIDRILGAAGLPPVRRRIPVRVAHAVGWLLEVGHRVLGIDREPRLTRFLARELSTAHWFDISAARRDLGYEPSCTIDEGMEALRRSLEVGDAW